MKFSKISPQKILHIEMRAKRAVTIFTARLALKATEKHKTKFFLSFKNGPCPHLFQYPFGSSFFQRDPCGFLFIGINSPNTEAFGLYDFMPFGEGAFLKKT